MKKLLLLSLFSFFLMNSTNAQSDGCVPNVQYQDSTFGVYPAPYNEDTNPNGGIQDTACVNTPYYFTWTIKIPETITIAGFTATIDSIIVAEAGAIINLPSGMEYSFTPSSGVFVPADSLACITIFGSPEAVGVSDLKIEMTIYSDDLVLIGNPQTVTLPDPLFPQADGNYFFHVKAEGDANCFVDSADDLLAETFSIRNVPNPFSDFTYIEIVADRSDDLIFRVFDLVGNEIHREVISVYEGTNNHEFDGGRLANGIYMYTIEKDGALVSEKMIINR
ncbi:MAG: T9SS type A sorting domain-containing protein [Saprospiraceae bacterium]